MNNMIPIRLVILTLSIFFGAGASAGDSFATQAKLKQCELTMEVAMMVGDMPDKIHVQNARTHLNELDGILTKAFRQHPDLSSEIGSSFSDEQQILVSEMFLSGYDTSSHLAFVIAQRNVTAALGKVTGNEVSAKQTLMAFDVCDVVANYLLITTSPLGPDNVANFNNDESDFPTRLARIDSDFESLSAGGKVNAEVLGKTKAHWNFIRAPLLNFNRTSTPYIVYRTGQTVVSNLLSMQIQ